MVTTGHEVSEATGDDLRLVDLTNLIKDTWRPAIIGFLLLGSAGLVLSFLIQPRYQAQVLLEYAGDPTKQERIGSSGGSLGGLAAIAGFSLGSEGNPKDAALAILRSWDFASEFIKTNALEPILNMEDWDENEKRWRTPAAPPDLWRTIKIFRRDILHVSDDAKTGLISVSVEWTDPVVAAEWATKLVSMINTRLQTTAIDETRRSIDHLNAELAGAQNTELQRAIVGLLQAQIEALMFADIRDEFAFRTIDPALAPPTNEYIFPNHIVFFLLSGLLGGLAASIVKVLTRKSART